MSPIVVIAIVVIAVLVGALAFAAKRSHDTDTALGVLSRETRSRDRKARQESVAAEEVVTGRQVERAAMLERKGGALVPVSEPAPPAPFAPPDPELVGVTRRQFLNRSIVSFFGLGLTGFGAGVLGFLWPTTTGGFGSVISLGSVSDIQAEITANNGFYYIPDGKMYITPYPAEALSKARSVYEPSVIAGMEAGIVALYQKCPHLGCRVPPCETSQWFECPCHGSQYNQAGEKKAGPAPRGMDHFGVAISGGNVSVDTGTVLLGPPIGTNTTGQESEGAHCISGGGDH